MKRITLLFATLLASIALMGQTSFYDFTLKTIDGKDYSFEQLKGKKVLIVNTASKCGLTPQYEELEKLHQMYGGDDFVLLGFPANNFMNQEPGSNAEIAAFCSSEYDVTFQMMSKISVKGDDMHPLYQWLTSREKNGVMDSKVSWNFQKYMIDAEGNLVDFAAPREKPMSEKILGWIASE